MNIGFFSPMFPPDSFGIGTYSKNIVEALADKGIVIDLITNCPPDYSYKNVIKHNTNPMGTKYVPLKWLNYLFAYNLFLTKLRKKINISHDNNLVSVGLTPPDVVTTHHLNYHLYKQLKMNPEKMKKLSFFSKKTVSYFSKLEELFIKRMNNFISLTPLITTELIEHFKVPKERIFTIPNGINLNEFSPHKKRKNFLLFAGRFCEEKGLYSLLEAVSLINLEDFKLVITGGDIMNPKNRLQKEIKQLEIQDKVEVLGFVSREKLIQLMGEAKGLILPSTYESFGITALEAMASKTPVLISDGCGLHEYLENQKNSLIFKPNSKDIAEAISEFWNDGKLQKRLAIQGYRKVKDFQWKNIAKQVIGVYEFAGKK